MEDSLYWIAYATQPSNIVSGPVTPSPFAAAIAPAAATAEGAQPATTPTATDGAAPAASLAVGANGDSGPYQLRKEHEELRRRIAVEAMGLSQRVPRVRRQVEHEQERISRLAEVYQVRMHLIYIVCDFVPVCQK